MEFRSPFHIPKLWPGATVFILGGGPSLSSVDLTPLHSQRVLGVNQAFRLGDWVDVLYFGDCGFYKQNRDALLDYGGLMISSCQRIPKSGWRGVNRVRRGKPVGIVLQSPDRVSWNYNSGASAINVAYWLGAKRVILLGFDMKRSAEGETHWHSHYGEHAALWSPYAQHLSGFPRIAKDAKRIGLEIINATPGSAIKEFPFMDFREVLK